jgi:hypothetical protein
METVVIDGTQYIKASVAAKRFKYTSDYIGQLCRAKKIDANLVGRTWFINPISLAEHRDNKYSTFRPEHKNEAKESADITSEVKDVTPVLKSKTARSVLTRPPGTEPSRSLIVNYEPDEESLIPKINKPEMKKSKDIVVKVYGGKNLRVKGGVAINKAKFTAEELPDIALSGKLAITSFPEAEDEEPDPTKKVSTVPNNNVISSKRDISASDDPSVKTTINLKTPPNSQQRKRKTNQEIKFLSNSMSTGAPNLVKISTAILISPLIASVLAILCVGLLFSASSNATVTNDSYQGEVILQMDNLLEILNR